MNELEEGEENRCHIFNDSFKNISESTFFVGIKFVNGNGNLG